MYRKSTYLGQVCIFNDEFFLRSVFKNHPHSLVLSRPAQNHDLAHTKNGMLYHVTHLKIIKSGYGSSHWYFSVGNRPLPAGSVPTGILSGLKILQEFHQ